MNLGVRESRCVRPTSANHLSNAGTRASLVPDSCRSFHFAHHCRSRHSCECRPRSAACAGFERTSRTMMVRGMSVSRRSSRFGGHPDAASCCRVTGSRFLRSRSEDAEPLTLLSPVRFSSRMNLRSQDESSFGPRLLLSLFREIERHPQSEAPSLVKNVSSIARPTPPAISRLHRRDPPNHAPSVTLRSPPPNRGDESIRTLDPRSLAVDFRPFDTRLHAIDMRGASLSQALLTEFCNS